nr:Chain C, GPI [synthetic construct]5AB2_D Chain D, GPI [synthetic construct]
GPGRAF